jgi:hypothetical protein
MDTVTAFANVRTTLATIVALQPEDATAKASTVGSTLVLRHADGSGSTTSFQYVAGGTMRAVTRSSTRLMLPSRFLSSPDAVTPLTTDQAVTDYLRALVVETLR